MEFGARPASPLLDETTRKEWESRLLLLQKFVDSPGYALFQASAQSAEDASYRMMTDITGGPHQMAVSVGAYHAIRDLKTWAYREMIAIQEALRPLPP